MIFLLLLFNLAWAQTSAPQTSAPQMLVEIGHGQVQVRTEGVTLSGDILDRLTAQILASEDFRDLVVQDTVTPLTLEGVDLQHELNQLTRAEEEFVDGVTALLREQRVGEVTFSRGFQSWMDRVKDGPEIWSEFKRVRESLWIPWVGFFFFWLILAAQNAVLSALSPFYVERVQWFLRDFKAGSFGLGLMAVMALPLLTLLLVVSVVGVMMLPLVFGLYVIWLLIGFMQVSIWLGGHVPSASSWPPSLRLGVGLLMVMVLSQVPLVGGFLLAYFSVLGFGAACRAMTSWVRIGA